MFFLKPSKQAIYSEGIERIVIEEQKRTHEQAEDLVISKKEFDTIRALCETCQNAIRYQYVPNPENSRVDPLFVTCKNKIIRERSKRDQSRMGCECWENKWHQKCISCSEYLPICNEK